LTAVPSPQQAWSTQHFPTAGLPGTLAPAATLWDPSQDTGPSPEATRPFANSPSPSAYSTSTGLSVMSSPYAHSEGYLATPRSPVIKLEEPLEPRAPPGGYNAAPASSIDELPIFQSSRSLRPLRLHGPLMHVKMEDQDLHHADDVKPYRLRPTHRRTYSYEDVRSDSREDRRKRGFTRPEDASCSCRKCGKLFQRSYNLKAHLETHDPHRAQPHECAYPRCHKRFVRRTDLVRHEQSVSLNMATIIV
jgi:hypothetical protein